MTDLKSTAISIEAAIHTALDKFFEEIHRDYGVRIESVHVDWSHFGIISTRLETSKVRSSTIGGSKMSEFTDEHLMRLIETTHSCDVPTRHIRVLANELFQIRREEARLRELLQRACHRLQVETQFDPEHMEAECNSDILVLDIIRALTEHKS